LNKHTGEFEVIEERAEIIRRVYSMTLEGIGKNTIARTLNAEGVPSFRSDRGKGIGWHESYVSKLLLNEAVIGRYQPHRMEESPKDGRRRRQPVGEPLDGYYPAIVALADFARVQHMRQGRKIPAGKVAVKYSNLFTGLGQCGVCGGPMHYEGQGTKGQGRELPYLLSCQEELGCPHLAGDTRRHRLTSS
jgi:hypothetical protein